MENDENKKTEDWKKWLAIIIIPIILGVGVTEAISRTEAELLFVPYIDAINDTHLGIYNLTTNGTICDGTGCIGTVNGSQTCNSTGICSGGDVAYMNYNNQNNFTVNDSVEIGGTLTVNTVLSAIATAAHFNGGVLIDPPGSETHQSAFILQADPSVNQFANQMEMRHPDNVVGATTRLAFSAGDHMSAMLEGYHVSTGPFQSGEFRFFTRYNSLNLQATLDRDGQWQLHSTGSDAGIRIGGDVNLYRNATDTLGIDDNVQINKSVYINENLTVKNNITGNFIYGEMWNYTPSDNPWQFDIGTANVYYNLSNLTNGECNGFTFHSESSPNGGSFLEANVSGLYKVSFTMSFRSENVGGLYGMGVTHNWNVTKHRDCYSRRAAATSVGNVGVTCLMDLAVGDNISVQIENENTGRDVFIHTANLNAVRVGD